MDDTALAQHLFSKGIRDPRVLAAIGGLSRSDFVPEDLVTRAPEDRALGIGHGQTISQPFVVAAMSEALALQPGDRVLEVGTGSGYQAAVLARMGADVWSIERLAPLAEAAHERLSRLGFGHVHLKLGDGTQGWPEAAPFRAIVVTAAGPNIPDALVEQIEPGGRLVAPVGPQEGPQQLLLLEKNDAGEVARIAPLLPVQFVPLVSGLENASV